MKKMLFVLVFFGLGTLHAENLVELTLLDHVSVMTQFRSGETRLALLDSVILLGKHEGKSIVDIQFGFNGATKPEPGEVQAADLLAGGFLKWGVFTNKFLNVPEHWEFLKSLEYGSSLHYNFRDRIWQGNYIQVGLTFDLNPR